MNINTIKVVENEQDTIIYKRSKSTNPNRRGKKNSMLSVTTSLPALNEDSSFEINQQESERKGSSLFRERRDTIPTTPDSNKEKFMANLYTKRLSFAMSRKKLTEPSKT